MNNIIALPKKQYNQVYNYLWLLSSAPKPISGKTKNKLLDKIISILYLQDGVGRHLMYLHTPTIDIANQKIMCCRTWRHQDQDQWNHQSVHIIQKQRD